MFIYGKAERINAGYDFNIGVFILFFFGRLVTKALEGASQQKVYTTYGL